MLRGMGCSLPVFNFGAKIVFSGVVFTKIYFATCTCDLSYVAQIRNGAEHVVHLNLYNICLSYTT